MKKSLVAAMFAVMMISLVGCGKAPEPRTVEATEVAEVVPTEAVEATEAAEDEAVEETTEVAEVVEETTEAPVAEESAEPYSYTDLNQTLYAQSTVNVRDLPEQTGAKLGSLTANQGVTVTGQCNETGWYRISYNGGEGFVSDSYLGSEKVAVKSSKAGSSTASQPASGSSTASQPAAEAPSETPADTGSTSSGSIMDAVDAGQITPDVQPGSTCGWCGAVLNSYEEALEHAKTVHGMQ